jgi:3-isopropylmalate dehydrogenase
MGSIGGDAATSPWYKLAPNLRPEAGLLALRKALNLYCNLRPAYLFKELADSCPLASGEDGRHFDLVICRELTGGLYFGERYTKEIDGVMTAVDTAVYNTEEIRRIAVKAFEIAMKRDRRVTSVDKANVLDTSRLWRKVVAEVAQDYPDVELSNMLVDNCAMQLVKDPEQFDDVVKALEKIPEVVECHYTTGQYDMFIKIYAMNNHHLLSIIHDKLQPLGLARTETLISFHEAIHRQMPIPNGTSDDE